MRRLLPIALLALLACGSGPVPGRQVNIDSSGMCYKAQPSSYDGTDKFTWDVQSQQAYVRYDGSSLTHGSVLVTFLDANNVRIQEDRIETGPAPQSQATAQGTPGTWTIRLDYSDTTGAVSICAAPAH